MERTGQILFPGIIGQQAALGPLSKSLAEIGSHHLNLAEFVGKRYKRQKRLIETAAQEFYLFTDNQILEQHDKLRMPPLNPLQENAGIVQDKANTGKSVEGGNKRFQFPYIEFLKFFG
jgi:hypothetical protein